jgi:hypothetical protein
MTLSKREYASEIIQVLTLLGAAAAEGTGWTRRGVRGWHFTDEMGEIFLAGVHLAQLARDGLVERDDVDDPGRKLPLYVHRITQAGEALLAEHQQRSARTVEPPREEPDEADLETLYLTADAWLALHALANASASDTWHRPSEITAMTGRSFYREEGAFLVSRGLFEMQEPDPERRTAPRTYRASLLGRAATLRDGTTSPSRVQIRVPGLRAATVRSA